MARAHARRTDARKVVNDRQGRQAERGVQGRCRAAAGLSRPEKRGKWPQKTCRDASARGDSETGEPEGSLHAIVVSTRVPLSAFLHSIRFRAPIESASASQGAGPGPLAPCLGWGEVGGSGSCALHPTYANRSLAASLANWATVGRDQIAADTPRRLQGGHGSSGSRPSAAAAAAPPLRGLACWSPGELPTGAAGRRAVF